MRSVKFGLATLTISAGLIMACNAQPPNGRKGPPPQWNPVHVFPPDLRDSLDLTEKQEKQIDDLEKEVRGRIDKILTAEQRRILSEFRPMRRGPGGPDGPGGPPDGPGGRLGRGGQRPGGPDRQGGPGKPPPPPPGGPDGFDGPPLPPSGPREWEEAADSLSLSDRQKEKSDDIIEMLREKVHKQTEQANAELLKQMKSVLNDRQFEQFEKALRQR